jgi:hypothetical protein
MPGSIRIPTRKTLRRIGLRHSEGLLVGVRVVGFLGAVSVPPKTGFDPTGLAESAGSDHWSLDANHGQLLDSPRQPQPQSTSNRRQPTPTDRACVSISSFFDHMHNTRSKRYCDDRLNSPSSTAKEVLTVAPGSVAGELTKTRGNARVLWSGPAVASLPEDLWNTPASIAWRQLRGARDVIEDDEI